MTFKLSLKTDLKKMTRDIRRIQGRIVPRITARAINTAAQQTQTRIIRGTTADSGVKQKVIRKRFRLIRSSAKTARAVIDVLTRAVPLSSLNPRQNKKGVRAGKFFRDKAFIQRKSGRDKVFKRTGESRYPIKHQVVEIQDIVDRQAKSQLATFTASKFVEEFQRLLKLDLRKKPRK